MNQWQFTFSSMPAGWSSGYWDRQKVPGSNSAGRKAVDTHSLDREIHPPTVSSVPRYGVA